MTSIFNPAGRRRILALGDSLSDHDFRTYSAWPAWLATFIPEACVISGGVSGNDVSNVLARLSPDGRVDIYSLYGNAPVGDFDEVRLLIGVNSLVFSTQTAAQMVADLASIEAWCTQHRRTFIPHTIMPFGAHSSWTLAMEADRGTVNTYIRGRPRAVDFETTMADITIPTQPKLKTTFDSGDGLHENVTGARHMALRSATVQA